MLPIVVWLAVGGFGTMIGAVAVVVANRRFRSSNAAVSVAVAEALPERAAVRESSVQSVVTV